MITITIIGDNIRVEGMPSGPSECEEDEILTADEAAIFLKMSPNHVRKLTKKGVLPGLKGGGAYRYSKKTLLNLVSGRNVNIEENE